MLNRRNFIANSARAGALLLLSPKLDLSAPPAPNELHLLCQSLANTWGEKLLQLLVTDPANTHYGGFVSPDNGQVPGRCGDAIYPFFYLANANQDHRYLDAAMLLYDRMERTVSQDDGSWLNEPVKGSWKGITVFTVIALGETLKWYGKDMSAAFRTKLEARLKKAGNYIRDNFNMDYGNINYPISATYGLALLDELLHEPDFRRKADELATQTLKFISPTDHLIFGEGTPYYKKSDKGCYPVDLGYNVEESLPSLVMYAKLTKNNELLEVLTQSLRAHLQFMLPDGAWDNSWGTRNFKWTYWGSRTSDGCQPAYAIMADRDPVFYQAALMNTKLLKECTHEGLLYGGPHYVSHGVRPSVHHTFCHLKALVSTLNYTKPSGSFAATPLPRSIAQGIHLFADIQTWLVSRDEFRATITGYDREYKETHNGHPTGGALSMLWHQATGPLFTASMNAYQLFEAGNMQPDTDTHSMPLTPRLEWRDGDNVFMNIADLKASIRTRENRVATIVQTTSSLVDKDQQSPGGIPVKCNVNYHFSKNLVIMQWSWQTTNQSVRPRIILPVISSSGEVVRMISAQHFEIDKPGATVIIKCDHDMQQLPVTGKRIFNFVPGLEALPLAIADNNSTITLEVRPQ